MLGAAMTSAVALAAEPTRTPHGSHVTVGASAPGGGVDTGGRSNRLTTAAPLTAAECTTLGGRVWTEVNHICRSGKFCETVDQHGEKHAVCISAAQ